MRYLRQTFTLLGLLVASCSTPLKSTPSPTLPPSPTPSPLPSPTPTIVPTRPPFTDLTPVVVIEQSDAPSTPTPTPPGFGLPPEELVILAPGPGSFVTSPFQISGRGGPSWHDRVDLRLLGEDARVLAETSTYLFVYPGNAGRFVTELSFSLPEGLVAEDGRLEVFTSSRRDGQLGHLASVDLILLSTGSPLVHPALAGAEKLAIFAPKKNAIIQGGLVTVSGGGWTDSDLPLILRVLDRQGNVVGEAQTQMQAAEVGQLGRFESEVVYQVPFSQYGRILVIEQAEGLSGFVHASSVDVYLQP